MTVLRGVKIKKLGPEDEEQKVEAHICEVGKHMILRHQY
jgi:hypothetical protein